MQLLDYYDDLQMSSFLETMGYLAIVMVRANLYSIQRP